MTAPEDFRVASPILEDSLLDGTIDVCDILELAESPGTPQRYAPTNAVHMEIQENAKLPTFNLAVDRKNSSIVPRRQTQQCSFSTRKELDEMIRLSENDFSLTEVFLKSTDRSSQNMNYSSAGALLNTLGTIGNRMGTKSGSSGRSNQAEQARTQNPASNAIRSPDTSGSQTAKSIISDQVINQQLPSSVTLSESATFSSLNTKPPPSFASAVATAAAIVSQAPTNVAVGDQTLPPNFSKSCGKESFKNSRSYQNAKQSITTSTVPVPQILYPSLPSSTPSAVAPITKQTNTQKKGHTAITSNPPTYVYPPPLSVTARPSHMPYSRLNATITAPTPKMADATKRRSQFGFGGNHQIPSVPMPPKRVSGNSKKSKKSKVAPVVPVILPHSANSGPAYERKKQRAKDARVKLNDSIERLSIAISLAGSQSKQRSSSLPSGTDTNLFRVMNDCAEIADSAKKWDRPEFVGTAATLIQGLNGQCEALMRELTRLQTNGIRRVNASTLPFGISKEQKVKRRKLLDTSQDAEDIRHKVLENSSILERIAFYLDPQSLLRCQCLTRTMHGIFCLDSLWLDRCVQRFGLFHVRQWQEKLFDDNEVNVQALLLYRKMDAANVRPVAGYPYILAEARMPNKISAWVTMVERSNGETYRSVQQQNEPKRYASLPVVELRLTIQNTGSPNPIGIKQQVFSVDASTRRRGEEWREITFDKRLEKRLLNLQDLPVSTSRQEAEENLLIRLNLYEVIVIVVFIQCRGCSTTSKFQRRANFTKVLFQLNGTTIPLVIPFLREIS